MDYRALALAFALVDHHTFALVLSLLGGAISLSLAALVRGYRRLCDFADRILSPE
jgi:hypothetical protein